MHPHSTIPARLTMALSEVVIVPEAIDASIFQKFGANKIIKYKGIDEVLWIQSFEENKDVLEELNLEPYKYVVLRHAESNSSYYQSFDGKVKWKDNIIELTQRKLEEGNLDFKIVVFPRYASQLKELERFGDKIIIPEQSVNTMNLLRFAKFVVTGGSTMSIEGSLLGTPTLSTFPLRLALLDYIKDKGFPIIQCRNPDKIEKKVEILLKTEKMDEKLRKALISDMETPYDGLIKALKEIGL